MKEELINKILEIEWNLFTNLKNTGARASCQDNKEEFYITRSSQWEVLSEIILKSYLDDLYRALDKGRNLLFEKYAYMMEYTHKSEYENLKEFLPVKDIAKEKLIDKIQEKIMTFEKEFFEKYPKFYTKTRKLEEINANDIAPIKVYLIGEHKTYSYKTNKLYLEFIENIEYNLVEKIYTNIITKRGYESIEEIENNY